MALNEADIDKDKALENLKTNYQRAKDFGNIEGLKDCLSEHSEKQTWISKLHIKALKEILGM